MSKNTENHSMDEIKETLGQMRAGEIDQVTGLYTSWVNERNDTQEK